MRLGKYPCRIKKGTKTHEAYKKELIYERHRHRYEFNNKYQDIMAKNGFIVTGLYPKAKLAELVELQNHPWFIGCQFHPEFKSKPDNCHPLFREFIRSSLECGAKRGKSE